MRPTLLLASILLTTAAHPQWQLLPTPTTADLRGIDNVGNGIVWASGTNGTVLRSTDDGAHWQTCPIPPAADQLDFRGIQAFDATTAIVMSSGPGDQSRLYKTTDACQTWKLLFTNPDKEGFWDAIKFRDSNYGVLLGDPVSGKFYARETLDGGLHWRRFIYDDMLDTISPSAGIFAASNSSLVIPVGSRVIFAVANIQNASAIFEADFAPYPCHNAVNQPVKNCGMSFQWGAFGDLPLSRTNGSSGVFSIAAKQKTSNGPIRLIAVGGDYKKPDSPGSAAYCVQNITDKSEGTDEWPWRPAQTPPHGYRSAVAYSPTTKTWITVGPNGTDISTDDGRNWRPLKPNPQNPATTPDEDQHWNALSLPFVVGPHGRIGKLRPTALITP